MYCRVLTASRDLEPTLSCVDASGKVINAEKPGGDDAIVAHWRVLLVFSFTLQLS